MFCGPKWQKSSNAKHHCWISPFHCLLKMSADKQANCVGLLINSTHKNVEINCNLISVPGQYKCTEIHQHVDSCCNSPEDLTVDLWWAECWLLCHAAHLVGGSVAGRNHIPSFKTFTSDSESSSSLEFDKSLQSCNCSCLQSLSSLPGQVTAGLVTKNIPKEQLSNELRCVHPVI